ncbi:membrane protein [Thioclava dalianensis]|uniref:Membrane protein n=1 Tax=Thioclava dalianensis TaxID=1185766 RepID=A0A074TES1_9RHOB|nr:DUF3429 domain-containing protein [Thioclava dalianensis]KEP68660.1 membrane protein [Thioclava dalianensis]SFM94486.1 Protein of unknown function [Thioclava dalianensis]
MRAIGPRIPGLALILGAAGLIPFLWGVLVVQTGAMVPPGMADPRIAVLAYALMIYCFMAGCLWGFAAKGEWSAGYAISIAPILLFIALVVLGMPINFALMIGFVLLLPLDYIFARSGLAPGWWMKLRIGLTAVVIACLIALVRT